MKIIVITLGLLLVSCSALAPKVEMAPAPVAPPAPAKFNTVNFNEQYVDRCIELCKDNPDIKLSVGTGEKLVYKCHCVSKEQ